MCLHDEIVHSGPWLEVDLCRHGIHKQLSKLLFTQFYEALGGATIQYICASQGGGQALVWGCRSGVGEVIAMFGTVVQVICYIFYYCRV